jgi:hypothetical protein
MSTVYLKCAVCGYRSKRINDDTDLDPATNKTVTIGNCCVKGCNVSNETSGTMLCGRHYYYVNDSRRAPWSICKAHMEEYVSVGKISACNVLEGNYADHTFTNHLTL